MKKALYERFFNKDKKACAEIISLVENNSLDEEIYEVIFPKVGKAFRVGITGPPGAGKSTLLDRLALLWREEDKYIGIVAVDPTSPFSGGAILGDRIRMNSLSLDDGVFIRSMASRGSAGGLARKTQEVCDVLDAFGCDVIGVETVGVGQSELDIVNAVDTTVVVLVPESGDSLQAMKAGLMEIGDIFVLNKADRPDANKVFSEIESILKLKDNVGWNTPLLRTVGTNGEGILKLREEIKRHKNYLEMSNALVEKHRHRLKNRIVAIVEEHIKEEFWKDKKVLLEEEIERIVTGKQNFFGAVRTILES